MRYRSGLFALILGAGCDGGRAPSGPDTDPPSDVGVCVPTAENAQVTLDGIRVFDDLQAALLAASPGSELVLCPGSHRGNFVATVPVRLVGLEDRAVTVLTGLSDLLPTLEIPGGSEIVNLTIRDGGGGVVMSSSGSLRIEASLVTGNVADYGAGLVVAENSTATLASTDIRGNSARVAGGGVWVRPGGTLELSEGSSISSNWADAFGAGVWLQEAHLVGGEVSGNLLVTNRLDELRIDPEDGSVVVGGEAFGGSGVALSGTGSVTDTEIAWNSGAGGGLSISFGTGTLRDVWVHDNDARPYACGGLGVAGGIAVIEGATRFERNSADTGGGGLVFHGSVFGGIFAENVATHGAGGLDVQSGELHHVVIRGNSSEGHFGGGLSTTGTAQLDGLTIEDNHVSGAGGGIHVSAIIDATVEISNTTIAGNEAHEGGGLYVRAGWTPLHVTLTNTTLHGNRAAGVGGGLHTNAPVDVRGGAIVGNLADSGGGAYIAAQGALSVTNTDLGAGESDNDPDDIATSVGSHQGYGAGASFACDDAGCTPTP